MIRRILIAGFGSIGRRHFRIAREAMPEAEIKVLRHKRPTDGSETAVAPGDMLYDPAEAVAFAPQLSVVATPAPFHRGIADTLLRAGSHVLIEKPLADVGEGLDDLVALARDRRLFLQTGYNLRYLPSLRRFRDFVGAGKVGEILSIRCEVGQYLPDWRPEQDYRDTVSANRTLGGGVLLELSHEIDYLRWIFGEINWVQAFLGRQSRLEIDVEDIAHLILGFDGSGMRPVASVSLDFIRRDTTRCCVVIGDRGSLRWDGVSGSVDFYDTGARKWEQLFAHMPERDFAYREQFKDVLARIEARSAPLTSGEDGHAVVRVLEAVRASAAASGVRREVCHAAG